MALGTLNFFLEKSLVFPWIPCDEAEPIAPIGRLRGSNLVLVERRDAISSCFLFMSSTVSGT